MKEGPRKSSSHLCNEGPEAADHLENKIVHFPLGRDITARKSAWVGCKLTRGADSVPVGCSKPPRSTAFFIFPDFITDFNGSCGPAGSSLGQTELVPARIS